jgi:CMP-N-acetylneuraminic acid synthetase/regulator of RNase E activity RraA
MKIIAVIPVKSTSSRVQSKNIRLLCNKPLFLHTLDKLLTIDELNEVWIDTDSMDIINLAIDYGYEGFKYFIRDEKYATNKTDGNTLLENEINHIDSDAYIQVLCTSPFTKTDTIVECCNILRGEEYTSVVGCAREKCYLWNDEGPLYDKHNIPNSNTLNDTIIESMSLYGITKKEFNSTGMRIGSNPYILTLDNEEMIDINYEKDFIYAEKLANYYKHNEQMEYDALKLRINSCMISDILRDLIGDDYQSCVLKDYNMNNSQKLFGRVRTLRVRDLEEDEDINDIYKCLKSYDNVNYGDIIFVDNAVKRKAYFGDLNATISMKCGAQGTIINGYTRDIDRINDLGYTVLYRGITCSDVKGYGTLDYYDKPLTIDNDEHTTTIYVDNLLFADVNGIVIIPRKYENEVLSKCYDIMVNESNISSFIIAGVSLDSIINKYGEF